MMLLLTKAVSRSATAPGSTWREGRAGMTGLALLRLARRVGWRPGNLHRVEPTQPILSECAVVDVGDGLRRPGLAARDLAQRGRMGVERDLVAARADHLAGDVSRTVARQEGDDRGHAFRRSHRLALPVFGQPLGHARVGG